jgi:replicative superfamily II helicase
MVGRAGRTVDRRGEAFIFAHSSTSTERSDILKLAQHQIPEILPHLRELGHIERFFLQCLSTGLLPNENALEAFLECTFRYEKNDDTTAVIHHELVQMGLIDETDSHVTQLGRAISSSSLSIEEGLLIAQDIQLLQDDVCLVDELHLLYLCVAPQIDTKPEPYNATNWLCIFDAHHHVIKLITKLPDSKLNRMQDLPMIRGGLGRIDPLIDSCMDRIYIAAVMQQLIDEVPLPEISKRFKIDRRTIQAIQMQCASFAAQVAKFCESLGAGLLAAALNRFRPRLNFAVRNELLGLLVLPACSKEIARKLVAVGITSPVELSELNAEMIAVILRGNGKGEITENEYKVADEIRKNAVEYTESLARLENMEEQSIQNLA